MKKQIRQLTLHKKTISNLDLADLSRYAAGGNATHGNKCTNDTCQGHSDTSCTCADSNWPWTCQGHTCKGNKCL